LKAGTITLGILSDIHYAAPPEQARGDDYEYRAIPNLLARSLVHLHRRFFWLRNPLHQGYLLDRFLGQVGPLDYLVAGGDYSCNSGFIGLADPAAFASARECLKKLRAQFADRLLPIIGDHELGKFSFVGKQGGMRLASWSRTVDDLGLPPIWSKNLGRYTLIGITSSLVALPLLEADVLPAELDAWRNLRETHLHQIRELFASIPSTQKILLFCHDPSALPFLWREPSVQQKLPQIERTIIGHLHSPLILWQSKLLAGMPVIRFLGHTAKKLSSALREAKWWKPFNVILCPALAGIQLLNDGGYYTLNLDPSANSPAQFTFHPLPRDKD